MNELYTFSKDSFSRLYSNIINNTSLTLAKISNTVYSTIIFRIVECVILFLIVFYVIFMLYIKIKHNFWAIQPVFHSYDLYYWLKLPFIIEPGHTGKKYVNFNNTAYYSFDTLNENTKVCNAFIDHLQTHYLREKEASYIPNKTHVLSHFKPGNSVFVLYYLNSQLVGCITSRFISAFINGQCHRSFYVDYLCVHRDYRKKGVAPELIETITYYQRKHHKDFDINIFKKENTSHWVISLVSYDTYFYEIDRWVLKDYKETVVRNGTALIQVTQGNVRLWLDFIKQQREKILNSNESKFDKIHNHVKTSKKYKCFVLSDDDILLNQIIKGVYLVYLLVQIGSNIPVACYIFKDSGTKYSLTNGSDTIGLEVQSCFKIDECDNDTFVDGFYHGLYKVQQITESIDTNKENSKNTENSEDSKKISKYQMLLFETIADNKIIRNNFLYNKKICFGKMSSTFYFYNYATKSIKPEEVVIIL